MSADVAEIVQLDLPPRHDLAWTRNESRTIALAALGLGAGALALLFVGGLVIAARYGITPVSSVINGLTSSQFAAVNLGAIGFGVAGIVLGWVFFRRMPTRLARNECIAGAVLGLQAAALGAFFYWFTRGDVSTFAHNYLDFSGHRAVHGPFDDIAEFVNGAKNTLILAGAGEVFGMILGLLLAVLVISRHAVVRAPARAYINFFRGTPLVWQLMIIGLSIPLAFPGTTFTQGMAWTYRAAILALALNAGAYTAEIFRAGIESIERGQLEAARGLGMSYLQAMRYSIVPQAIRRVIPPLMNEFVILVKDTSLVIVLGLTAGQRELMNVGNNGYSNTFNSTYLVMTAAGYLVVTLPLIRLVNFVEKRLRSGLVGVTA
ncbi:MAG: amino acid ABC transporter permease [Actinomycetota bacterium]